jgi:hypothetical protein
MTINKQDALKKLTALEAEAKALRAIIEAPEVPTRWKPESGDNYYQVAFDGGINVFGASSMDCKEYAHGNCYRSREHADIAADAVSRTLKIVACALEVDPDAGELHKTQRRWTVVKDITTRKWEVTWSVHIQTGPIYVHTREQADQLAAMLNAEGV